jgi:hypothetical protein
MVVGDAHPTTDLRYNVSAPCEPMVEHRRPTAVKRGGTTPAECKARGEDRPQVFWAEGATPWKVSMKALFLKRVKGCTIGGRSRDILLNKIQRATVIILTGHHYVAGGEIGHTDFFGKTRPLSIITGYSERTRLSRVVSQRARLIVTTGCLWLASRTANFLAVAFPQAVVLGFAAKSLFYKGEFWDNFIRSIPDVLALNGKVLESSMSQHQILQKWIQFIEKADSDKTLSKGAHRMEGGWANPTWSKPAYMSPGGCVWIWSTRTKMWHEQKWPATNSAGIGPIHPPGKSVSLVDGAH